MCGLDQEHVARPTVPNALLRCRCLLIETRADQRAGAAGAEGRWLNGGGVAPFAVSVLNWRR